MAGAEIGLEIGGFGVNGRREVDVVFSHSHSLAEPTNRKVSIHLTISN